MKIVHVDLGKTLRGGQEKLLLLARGLRDRGHEQWLVCQIGSALEGWARDQGFPALTVPGFDPGQLGAIRRLRRTLKVERPEILHAHDARGQNLAWLGSQFLPVRRVVNRDVTFHPRMPGGLWLQGLKYAHTADFVITCSDYIRQSLIESGVPADRIEVIYPASEWPEDPTSDHKRSAARAASGFREQDFVAGHVGAFTHEKGQDIAIESAMILKQKLPNGRIVLAGEVSAEAMRELRRRYPGLQDFIHLPGYVADLEMFFAALDLFIMPSRDEGLGISAIQAMARGLAVVASRVGGLPEIVEEGQTGWLVPPGSPQALADAIVQAASEPARLHEMGNKARQRALQFSSTLMVKRTEALYERLAGKNKVQSRKSKVES
ncbi:MAG TPA: glycosyltransferase family 4 protein [Terriglobia bacterium]|nr:glycosyltransferase family 4 protein [Terriglobia bacterium]